MRTVGELEVDGAAPVVAGDRPAVLIGPRDHGRAGRERQAEDVLAHPCHDADQRRVLHRPQDARGVHVDEAVGPVADGALLVEVDCVEGEVPHALDRCEPGLAYDELGRHAAMVPRHAGSASASWSPVRKVRAPRSAP